MVRMEMADTTVDKIMATTFGVRAKKLILGQRHRLPG
jgi:hypothetical protein